MKCQYINCCEIFETTRSFKKYCSKRCSVLQATLIKRMKHKKRAVDYLGGKCIKCNYDKSYSALVFHHLDPTTKKFGLGKKGWVCSWETVKKELDKCELLCANCHAESHSSYLDKIFPRSHLFPPSSNSQDLPLMSE